MATTTTNDRIERASRLVRMASRGRNLGIRADAAIARATKAARTAAELVLRETDDEFAGYCVSLATEAAELALCLALQAATAEHLLETSDLRRRIDNAAALAEVSADTARKAEHPAVAWAAFDRAEEARKECRRLAESSPQARVAREWADAELPSGADHKAKDRAAEDVARLFWPRYSDARAAAMRARRAATRLQPVRP